MQPNPAAFGVVRTMLRPYRRHLSAALVLGLISTAVSLTQPILLGDVVGKVTGGHPAAAAVGLLATFFVVDLVVGGLEMYVLGRAGVSLVLSARQMAVRRLLRAPVPVHMGLRRGDLSVGAVADTDLLRTSLVQVIANILASVVLVLGSLTLMMIIDPVLTLVALLMLGLVGVFGLLVAKPVRRAAEETRAHVGAFGAAVERALAALRTVKLSGAEDVEEARVLEAAGRAHDASQRGVFWEAAMAPLVTLGVQGAFALVFTVSAFRIADGALTAAGFASYLLYLFYMIAPLLTLFLSLNQLQLGLAAAGRVAAFERLPDEREYRAEESLADQSAPSSCAGPVLRFDRVSFGYPGKPELLRELSFDVPRRGLTAIVGPSGAGKSTLFALATQLWDGHSGTIELNGVDVQRLRLGEIRSRIGYVEQDAPVLHGTIRDNLLYAHPDASESELRAAVETAGLAEWVDRLPQGLDTEVGEAGTAISGGQRQRVAIARMILPRPDVLLLDEATSQLDEDTERDLLDALARVARTCAVVAIAHRPSIVAAADQVVAVGGAGAEAALSGAAPAGGKA